MSKKDSLEQFSNTLFLSDFTLYCTKSFKLLVQLPIEKSNNS